MIILVTCVDRYIAFPNWNLDAKSNCHTAFVRLRIRVQQPDLKFEILARLLHKIATCYTICNSSRLKRWLNGYRWSALEAFSSFKNAILKKSGFYWKNFPRTVLLLTMDVEIKSADSFINHFWWLLGNDDTLKTKSAIPGSTVTTSSRKCFFCFT